MKSIVEYTKEEAEAMTKKWHELRDKASSVPRTEWFDNYTRTSSVPRTEWFDNYTRARGYAHYKFSGDITDKLVEALGHEPSPDEIIMLVDDGFSHFGASCSINGRHFSGRVNID